ncbi:hypothetical protein OG496_09040 [Streptomyces sp. NBC_00988]|uniref:hypothetical protein n=1 Tax=Streptomyces sp. NBC_00988 TaxID=2903704 RepID=UPI003868B563|nr:hypothetical protein OG496_09040 [Streptomyces sp. NBC_00988]
MSLTHQVTAGARIHWRLVILPVGFTLNVWGNALFDTSPDVTNRAASLLLFAVGLFLALYGCRFWRSRAEKWYALQRVSRWMSGKRNDTAWQHRWWRVKVTVLGVGVCGVVLYAVRLVNGVAQHPDQVTEHAASAMTFMYVWGLLPMWTQAVEPKGASTQQLLEDTGRRVGRAAIGRTVANTAGIYFAGAVVYMLVFPSRPALLVPAAVTLGAAMIATGHETWTRLRKLSTQLHTHIQTLERDLAMIPSSQDATREKQDAARRSWDAVQRDLWTSVDTGYGIFGIPFVPRETARDLGVRTEQAIEALEHDQDAARDVLIDLATIKEACSDRIDSVA